MARGAAWLGMQTVVGIVMVVVSLALYSGPARAQFVCAGTGATATGNDSLACGNFAHSNGTASTAVGTGAIADGGLSVAVGVFADANGGGSLALGGGNNSSLGPSAEGLFSAALLRGSHAASDNSIAFGNLAESIGDSAIAVGKQSTVNGENSVAVGALNSVTGNNSGAFGTGQTVNGNGSFAIGDPNTVNGNNSFVFGDNNTINADNAIAIGNANTLNGNNAMAIGNGSQANFANSAAFGNGATVTRANQQVFGTAANTYTMGGITSAASKAAQSGPTQLVTSDASGNLATTTLADLGLASSTEINNINTQLASLQTQIVYNQREARAGTALALAASQLDYDMRPGKFSLAAALGFFKGASGLAAGLGYAVNDRLRVNAAFSGSPDVEDYGVSVGASVTLN